VVEDLEGGRYMNLERAKRVLLAVVLTLLFLALLLYVPLCLVMELGGLPPWRWVGLVLAAIASVGCAVCVYRKALRIHDKATAITVGVVVFGTGWVVFPLLQCWG
jgi:O-antigen/teichoic acid export membrane protein